MILSLGFPGFVFGTSDMRLSHSGMEWGGLENTASSFWLTARSQEAIPDYPMIKEEDREWPPADPYNRVDGLP